MKMCVCVGVCVWCVCECVWMCRCVTVRVCAGVRGCVGVSRYVCVHMCGGWVCGCVGVGVGVVSVQTAAQQQTKPAQQFCLQS